METRYDQLLNWVETEVGDTDLVRARHLERKVGLRQLWLKLEGSNPTGTHKDRIASAQVLDAVRRGFDTVCAASCGNYGVAVATLCAQAGLRCEIAIPEGYHTRRLGELETLKAAVVRTPGDYEAAVEASRVRAVELEAYDANPGGENALVQLGAYSEIAAEIYDTLRDAPRAVALPVSNGTTLAGVHRGFESLNRRGRTSRIPWMVAGSSHGKNPIVRSWVLNDTTCVDLPPHRIHESSVNEALVNWHAIDGNEALDAVRRSEGWAADVSDKKLVAMARELRSQQGLDVLPASCAGLVALLERHQQEPLAPDRYVAVITGRKG